MTSEAEQQSQGIDEQQSQDNDTTSAEHQDANAEELIFKELELDETLAQATKDSWTLLLRQAESAQAAGEAIFQTLWDSAPSLQHLFVVPKAVQAMRFINGIQAIVDVLYSSTRLKAQVETMGFGHLHLDVTPARCKLFQGALIDFFVVELGDKLTPIAAEGWKRVLGYVASGLMWVGANYKERVHTLLRSWAKSNDDADKDKKKVDAKDRNAASGEDEEKAASIAASKKEGAIKKGENEEKKG